MRYRLFLLLFLSGVIFSSCVTVQPWEREYLADPIMGFEGDEADAFAEEVTEIREASALGKGGDGGGCGCN